MTIDEAILYMKCYQNKLKTSVSLGLDKDIEAYDIAICALERLKELRKSDYLSELKEHLRGGD